MLGTAAIGVPIVKNGSDMSKCERPHAGRGLGAFFILAGTRMRGVALSDWVS